MRPEGGSLTHSFVCTWMITQGGEIRGHALHAQAEEWDARAGDTGKPAFDTGETTPEG